MPGPLLFNPQNVFYPLVQHFFASVVGFKELAGHGTVLLLREAIAGREVPPELLEGVDDDERPLMHAAVGGRPELLETMVLWCTDNPEIRLPLDDVAGDIVRNREQVVGRLYSLAAAPLLITAWETSKALGYTTTDPIWEFLRHCRNGSAHGGKVTFLRDEPRRPAAWGSLRFEKALQGRRLVGQTIGDGSFLRSGDPVRLLWDIEQRFPNLAMPA
jgi:hypothetical protein